MSRYRYLWVILVLCLALAPPSKALAAKFECSAVTQLPQTECEALVALYQHTGGDDWLEKTNWLVTNAPCTWTGVICDEGHVVELYLPKNHLRGQIPAALNQLTKLAFLDLSFNQLESSLPASLANLAKLEELYLQANVNLSGSLPGDFVNLQALALLWVDGTNVCGVGARMETDEDEMVVNSAGLSAIDAWLVNVEELSGSNVTCDKKLWLSLVPVFNGR